MAHVCVSCGREFPPLSEDEQLADKLCDQFYKARHPNKSPNRSLWHDLHPSERVAWLAVVKAAREKLIDTQGPIE